MNVNVRIKLPSNNQLQKEIQQAVKLMEKYSLLEMKIDTKSFTKSLSSMSNELSKLKTQLSKFNILDNIVDDSKIIQSKKQVNDLADTIGKLNEKSQIKVKNNDRDAELKQAQAINKALDEQYSKQQNLNTLQGNLQYKLDIAKGNSFIDDSVITKLQSQLDSINTNTSEKEISELKIAINNLSSTDGSIVRVQNSIVKLQQRISNIKDNKIDIVDKNDIAELKQAENELSNLKNILNQLQGGEVIDGKKISSSINTATNSVRTLENSFKGANTVAGGLSNTVKNMFSYIAGGSLGYLAVSNIKESVSTVIELNTAMTGLKKVTDETNATYDKFLKNMHNVSLELGTQSNKMIDAVTNWSKTGESLARASKLAENTILLTKVGDVESVDTAQNYMLPALKAFNIEAENSINLINEYNNISNNMATTTNDIGSAMSKSASSMAVAGNTLEQTIAMIATAESITKLGGDSIGQAMKSLSMRLATFKDDETGEIIPKMAESIKSLTNVDITDLNGQLKNTYDIYMEIGQVYKDLDKNSQLQINEILGGKLRGNVVSAILSNVDELQRAYDLANNSAGSAMAEFEKYQDSIQYSVDRLKEQINGLYTTFVDSDFLKGVTEGAVSSISTIQKVLDTFGAFPTVVSTAVASLVIFNGKFRETTQMMLSFSPTLSKVFSSLDGLSTSLKSNANTYSTQISRLKELTIEYQKSGVSTSAFGGDLARLQGKLVLTQAGLVAVKVASVALQSIISMGLTLGVSMLVSGFVKLADSLVLTKSELKELNNEFSSTASQSNATKLNDLIDKYEELDLKLATLKVNTEEYKNKESELAKIQEQIIQLYPQASELIDGNTEAKRLNLEKTKELAEEELNILKAKAIKTLDNNEITNTDDIKKAIQDYEVYSKVIEKVVDLNGKGSANIDVGDWNDSGKLLVTARDVETYTKRLEESKTKLEALVEATKLMESENKDLEGSTYLLEKALNQVNDELSNVSNNDMSSSLDELSNSADGATTSIGGLTDEVKGLNDALSNLKNVNDLIKQAVDEFTTYGELTEDTYDKILSSGTPEMVTALQDANTFLETYNRLLVEGEELEENQRQAIINKNNEILNLANTTADVIDQNATNYNIDADNYAKANESKIENSILFTNKTIDETANATTQNGKNYVTDQENWRGIAQGKLGIADDFVNGAMSGIATYTTNAGENYIRDSDNFVTQVNVKIEAMRRLQQSLDTFASNKIEFGGGRGILKPTDTALKDMGITINKTGGGSYVNASKGGGYVKGSANKVNNGVGHGANTSDKGNSSKDKEKEIEDLEDLTDRYYNYEDAIEDVNNALEITKHLRENSYGIEKINYMQKEIDLYKQQQKAIENYINAYKKEQQEIKNSIVSKGAKVDNNGNITNYNELLNSKRNWANSLSGSAKESAISSVKELEESLKRYTELTNNLIPSMEKEWQSLGSTIKSVYKEQAEVISKVEQDIYETIKYYAEKSTETKQKELQKQIDLLNKSYDDEAEEEALNKQRQTVTELLNEMAKYESSVDAKGKAKYQQLLAEYEEQQAELNSMIKEAQKESMIAGIEEEKDKLDEELEDLLSPANMNKLIADALSSGMVEIGGEVVDLSKAMSTMLQETTIGTQTLIQANNEWVNSLKEATGLYSNIADINSKLGLTSVSGLSGRNIDNRAITIQVSVPEVAGGVTGQDVANEIKKALKEYDNKFK